MREKSNRPRYWDGRVREVVETVRVIKTHGSRGGFTTAIERLNCGHLFARTGKCGGGTVKQFRVCDECPGMAAEVK